MIAETAVLAVELVLRDKLSAGVAKVKGELAGLEASATRAATRGVTPLTTKFGSASVAAATFGSAIGRAESRIGSILTGPAGFIGLSIGVGLATKAFVSGIQKARQFGETAETMAGLTGLAVDKASELTAAFDHFGIEGTDVIRIFGLMETNLGNLTDTQKEATKFQTDYGLSLTDTNGKVKDANQLILDSADFYNNDLIPAQTKAAALQKLYGQSWRELIPVLREGSKAIGDAEEEAAALGLTVTPENMKDLERLRQMTQDLDTAMGGLQLQIGLALVPAFSDLAGVVTGFVRENRTGIVEFFKGAAGFARDFGNVMGATVVPAFGALATAWGAIPTPLKQLLIGGFVANKASKMIFDIGIGDVVKGGIELFGKRGLSPANPLFVSDIQNRLPNGQYAPGFKPTRLGQIASVASKVFLVGAAIGVFAELKGILDEQSAANHQTETDQQKQLADFIALGNKDAMVQALSGLQSDYDRLNNSFSAEGFAFQFNVDGVRDAVELEMATLRAAIDRLPGGIANAIGGRLYNPNAPGRPTKDDIVDPGTRKPFVPRVHIPARPHRAAGGPVSEGMEYIIGEHGPERFRPRRSGQIFPFGGKRADDFRGRPAPNYDDPTGSLQFREAAIAHARLLNLHSRVAGLVGGRGRRTNKDVFVRSAQLDASQITDFRQHGLVGNIGRTPGDLSYPYPLSPGQMLLRRFAERHFYSLPWERGRDGQRRAPDRIVGAVVSTRDVNTAQNIKRRYGPTPTQAGAA